MDPMTMYDQLQAMPDGPSEMNARPAPVNNGGTLSAATPDAAMEYEINSLLAAERNRPSLIYDEIPLTGPTHDEPMARPQEPVQQYAPPQQYQQPQADPMMYRVLDRLQTLESENQHLARRADRAEMYENLLRVDPTAAARMAGVRPPQQEEEEEDDSFLDPTIRDMRRELKNTQRSLRETQHELKTEATRARLLAESNELARRFQGAFNLPAVAKYAKENGYDRLDVAYRNMVGDAVLSSYESNMLANEAQARIAAQQYAYQQQQQQAYAPQQYQGPQVAAPQMNVPPPSSEAVVGVPGGRMPSRDALDSAKPQTWSQVGGLALSDARKIFGPNV